jgi:chromosomal replication initiation ATPase DnaA
VSDAELVISRTAAAHGLTVGILKLAGRGPARESRARADAMWELRELGLSYPAIGRLLGGRHHTTVMHLVALTARRMARRTQQFTYAPGY